MRCPGKPASRWRRNDKRASWRRSATQSRGRSGRDKYKEASMASVIGLVLIFCRKSPQAEGCFRTSANARIRIESAGVLAVAALVSNGDAIRCNFARFFLLR